MSSEITSTVTLAWCGSDFSHQYTLSIQVVRQSLETQFPAWWKIEYTNALWSYKDAKNCWYHPDLVPSFTFSWPFFRGPWNRSDSLRGSTLFFLRKRKRGRGYIVSVTMLRKPEIEFPRVGQTKTSMRCIWCYGRQRFCPLWRYMGLCRGEDRIITIDACKGNY